MSSRTVGPYVEFVLFERNSETFAVTPEVRYALQKIYWF